MPFWGKKLLPFIPERRKKESVVRNWVTIVEGSSSVWVKKKSPGSRNVVPYTISADVNDKSSLSIALIPSCRVSDKLSVHFLNACGSAPLNHLLADGTLVVQVLLVPRSFISAWQK